MNKALLAEWWIRFLDTTVQGKWKEIIKVKYGKSKSSSRCSPFWKAILKDNDMISLGLNKDYWQW